MRFILTVSLFIITQLNDGQLVTVNHLIDSSSNHFSRGNNVIICVDLDNDSDVVYTSRSTGVLAYYTNMGLSSF